MLIHETAGITDTECRIQLNINSPIGEKPEWIRFNEIIKMPPDSEPADLYEDDLFIKYFTSGTTGMPKAVKHSSILVFPQ